MMRLRKLQPGCAFCLSATFVDAAANKMMTLQESEPRLGRLFTATRRVGLGSSGSLGRISPSRTLARLVAPRIQTHCILFRSRVDDAVARFRSVTPAGASHQNGWPALCRQASATKRRANCQGGSRFVRRKGGSDCASSRHNQSDQILHAIYARMLARIAASGA